MNLILPLRLGASPARTLNLNKTMKTKLTTIIAAIALLPLAGFAQTPPTPPVPLRWLIQAQMNVQWNSDPQKKKTMMIIITQSNNANGRAPSNAQS